MRLLFVHSDSEYAACDLVEVFQDLVIVPKLLINKAHYKEFAPLVKCSYLCTSAGLPLC